MVNAQEWLDKNYPNKENVEWIGRQISRGFDIISNRREIDSVYENELAGKLVIKDFPNLEKIYLDLDDEEFYNYEGKLTSLEIVNCPNLTELWCQHNQLTRIVLDQCPELTKIACAGNQLTSINLTSLTNLKELNCGNNQLISLDLKNNNQLEDVVCHKNLLKSIELPINPKNLNRLFLNNNDFLPQNLDFLKNCTNLTVLRLDNSREEKEENKEMIEDKNIYNRFYGSLESLKDMIWLNYLDISDTDIDSGLEYLPTEDLKDFRCYVKNRPQSKVVKIAQICDGGIIINEVNKKTLIQVQIAIMKEKGLDIDKLQDKGEKEISASDYKTSEQWLKELGMKSDPAEVAKFVDAQWWLDQNYPKKDRKNITELSIPPMNFLSKEKKLIGSLRIEGFRNLRELNCGGNLLTDLEIVNCPNLKNLECYSNRLTNLEIKDLPRIATIDCTFNQLTGISITNCSQFSSLSVSNNLLTSLDFLSNLDPAKMVFLNVANNNFPKQKLSIFDRFVNLRDLSVGNWNEEQIQQGIYNRFYGSLEPLRNLTKLEQLNISNSDINEGLEYLPLKKLNSFDCSAKGRKGAKVSKFYNICGSEDFLKGNFDEERLQKYMINLKKQQSETLPKSEVLLATSLREEETPNLSQTSSSSKKSKNAKRKEKLNTAQGQINQLQTELEAEKTKSANLQKEHAFYKNFFDNSFQNKKTELAELKNKLNKEEQEWLDIYCEASQETEKSSFVKKQLTRAKENLKEKFSEEELRLILEKRTEIKELENQLNNLQIQEAQIEVLPK
ncbi:MAG: hypothetical protein I3273_02935 [Candidatus Moeniiplasma glomeromycotorum]|nr:hypothetical protein [Candidatus Moeniiplasma glomeromycotorum]MCE8167588.1 hypothetical protein [Candidatus Moeniiplasma glomeromycotorum]MCE8169061.1 hypothetical protein [Candidatus Moeniiplasma glomeromycotorum]